MKIFIFLFTIIWIDSAIKAQSAVCDYDIQYFWTTGYINSNNSYYSCYLKTINASSIDKINGQHVSSHSDDDVTYFFIEKGNSIKTFSSIFCQMFKNLEVIRTSDADIHSINGNSLENCENLDILDLAGTKIRYLPKDLLIKNTKVSQIWFRDSPLATLPENLLINQSNLKILHLKGNQINFLPAKIFHPLIQLEALYLQHNKLQSINPEWFKSLQALKWLFFNDNQIAAIPAKSFESLPELTELYLYKNKIKFLTSNSFDGLHNLKILNLYGNEITELPRNVFSRLSNLQELSLFNNKLTVVHAASFGIHNNLVDIYLGSNRINQIEKSLIDKTAVNFINMEGNICSRDKLKGIDNIKAGLKTCFENHDNKIQELLTSLVKVVRAYICGKPVRGVGNIVGGQHVARGNFPWVTALVTPSGDYFCGGTLVSNRKVVTDKHDPSPKMAGEIITQLGVYDLKRVVEVGRVSYAVQRINVHPDWNTLTEPFDADLAVLVLDREVTFNEFIHPICLAGVHVATIATGVVVGYGKSEDKTKIHETIPKVIATPIHTNEHCFLKNSNLVKISSKRTFCGGSGTGVGVCRGDSGSGLFVTDGSAYYLRGIVSSSIIGGRYGCDVDSYSVFTDVAKYVNWINGVSTDRFD
ncbi:hypothetical protein ACKWTF_015288 [Chironomus riparius]